MNQVKILIPTDFSTGARAALDYAFSLFGKEDAEYTLLNLYHEPHAAATSMISLVDIAMQDSRNSLNQEMGIVRSNYGEGYKVGYLSEYGEGGKHISNVARKYHMDYIVMGSKGASGLKEVLVGSVASDTINQSDVPVLMIPDGATYSKPKSIVIAVDEDVQLDLLDKVRSFASRFNAAITFLKVSNGEVVPRYVKEGLSKPAFVGEAESYAEVQAEDAVKGITQFSAEHGADVLVMFPGTHGFLDRLFKRSHTGKVAMHSSIPLLTIHK